MLHIAPHGGRDGSRDSQKTSGLTLTHIPKHVINRDLGAPFSHLYTVCPCGGRRGGPRGGPGASVRSLSLLYLAV